ncbi:MAG: FkbM family methyltransferase [Verrucomicrobiota bacterium]
MKFAKQIAAKLGYKLQRKQDVQWGTNLIDDLDRIISRTDARMVFDVGANVGQSTGWMRGAFPQAHIHCFEPVRNTFEKLEQRARGVRDVSCHLLALGAEEKGGVMYTDPQGDRSTRNSFILCPEENVVQQEPEEVQVTTLDLFCRSNRIDNISFLKLDVEGYELEMLRGADLMLSSQKISMIYCEASLLPERRTQVFLGQLMEVFQQYRYELVGIYGQEFNQLRGRVEFANVLFWCSPTQKGKR